MKQEEGSFHLGFCPTLENKFKLLLKLEASNGTFVGRVFFGMVEELTISDFKF